MVDKIEMSLDEIIKKSKASKRGRGSGGGGGARRSNPQRSNSFRGSNRNSRGVQRGRNRGGIARPQNLPFSKGDVNSAWKHDMFDGFGGKKTVMRRSDGAASVGPTKLMVSNLDFGVSESDIQELFAEFGPLKSASVHYDRSGRSLGSADVVFERRTDAVKAMKQYNGVPLDGRAMNIQLTTSEIPSSTRPRMGFSDRSDNKRGFENRGNRSRGAASGRGGGRNNSRGNAPTAEQLDAELDAYVKEIK
ncbi:THO complex subunit 4-like isoform X2 [Ctenocephalides felis]|uniref:THO complex subunit 4-like isoform X2 n=1 Tax=Ctenocephalides felis TaxID=7515 RepID=UPI000E6E2480|nr:THO complex subunit 4-like isoform X2 [Ctenocephalides felis]